MSNVTLVMSVTFGLYIHGLWCQVQITYLLQNTHTHTIFIVSYRPKWP